MTARIVTTLLVLTIAACSPPGTAIWARRDDNLGGCFADPFTGTLVLEDHFGSAVVFDADTEPTRAVLWPYGYSARPVGTDLVILDRDGRAVARTGGRYSLGGTYWPWGVPSDEPGADWIFYACGAIEPLAVAG